MSTQAKKDAIEAINGAKSAITRMKDKLATSNEKKRNYLHQIRKLKKEMEESAEILDMINRERNPKGQ